VRNRLLSAGGVTNTYDAQGLRISMADASGGTDYVYDTRGASKVLQRTRNGSTVRSVWGFGLLYDVDENGEAVYYHYDERGNTVALSDESGTVTDRMEYAPYGTLTHREGATETPFLFGGLYGVQTDSNGLLHMRARFYNPLTRRFLNADPARDGWNWYAFANGNPVDLTDPLGLGPQQTGFSKALDWVQGGLDVIGTFEPTPFADLTNAGISALRGDKIGVGASLAGIIPYIGDAGKLAKYGLRYGDEVAALARRLPAPKMKTVLGNGADVAPFRGKSGYNVLDMDRTLPIDTRKAININWLDDAINRGDDIILKTDPIKWDQFMRGIGKESFYNEVELPHLLKRGVIDNVILDYLRVLTSDS
jgi:RHS repeat-associated protein